MTTHKPGKIQNKPKKVRRQRSLADKEEAAHKKKVLVMSVILVSLMLVSLVGIFASSIGGSSDPSLQYNGLSFSPEQRGDLNGQTVLTIKINGKEVYFYTMPQDSLNILTTGNLSDALSQASIIAITSNPSDQAAPYYDLIRYDLSLYGSKSIVGATTQAVDGISLPVLTCENATATTPIISLASGNTTSINVEDNCVIVTSTLSDFAIIRDRLLYTLLGVLTN